MTNTERLLKNVDTDTLQVVLDQADLEYEDLHEKINDCMKRRAIIRRVLASRVHDVCAPAQLTTRDI